MTNFNEQDITLEGSFRYTCGFCGSSSNEISIFGSEGKCASCGGANPEFSFFAEGKSFPESVLVYFAEDAKLDGVALIRNLKSQGFKVITRTQLDLRNFDDSRDAQRLIRDRMGGIIIIPSDNLVETESENIEFLFNDNQLIPKAGIAKAVFMVTDLSQKKFLTELHDKSHSTITAIALCEGADYEKTDGVMILGNDSLGRSLEYFKSKWFKT